MVANMVLLVLSGDDGTVTPNWKMSVWGFQITLSTLIYSLSCRTLCVANTWSAGSRSDNRSGVLLDHFRRRKPPFLSNSINWSRICPVSTLSFAPKAQSSMYVNVCMDDVELGPLAEIPCLHLPRVDSKLEGPNRERWLCRRWLSTDGTSWWIHLGKIATLCADRCSGCLREFTDTFRQYQQISNDLGATALW